ncbi:MAG: hypothetical protein KDN19_13730 [Verrucomicrobiae bacterium]|nr:hypothetical protein [Verrucomicrobiae bacterium]
MKTILAIAAATAALFTFGAPKAEAGPSCQVHSYCDHCHSPIYSYYRPIRYVNNCAVYGWVPSVHTNCHSNSGLSIRFYSGPSSIRYYNYGYRSVPSYSRGCSSRSVQSYRSVRSYPVFRSRSFSHCR